MIGRMKALYRNLCRQ